MPCKIEIRQNLNDEIINKSESLLGANLDFANREANKINKSYGYNVLSFYEGENDYTLKRKVTIPEELVSKYYKQELLLEEKEDNIRREEGNWNIDEEGNITPFQQKETTKQSTASPELLNKIRGILKNKGVRMENLVEYAKKTGLNINGVNAVADTIRNIIAIAHGKEDVALTEEFVHIATAAIEQSSPKLIEEMMSKINRFKIYNVVLNLYKNDENYQLANGKPDIRKIKKEAVDKLIAEVIINNSENTTEFPELLEEENVTLVERWWNAIKDFFKGMYKASNINIFEEAASKVMEGEFTPTANEQGEVMFQKENNALNITYDDILQKSKNLVLFPEEEDRHYEYNGERVAISVTEKIKKLAKPLDRTEAQKKLDKQKAAWGIEGHNYIANQLAINFIDENGYKRETPLNDKISSPLSEKQMEVLRAFCVELMSQYNVPGTRFIIEGGIVNPKVKGMIAGTTDFVALVPNDSKEGFYMDILDWKFIDNIAEKEGDVHHKKAEQWNAQMNEYINIYTQGYGVKPQQIKKSRMIPFISTYEYGILGDKTSDLNLSSIQVGSLTNPDDTKLYTLAVPTLTEDTGNPRVNQFIRALNSHWKKLYDRHSSEEERDDKIEELNRIRRAIRLLHVKMNFEPLLGVTKTFLNNIDKSLKQFSPEELTTLSTAELSQRMKLLNEYQESAEKFLDIDEIYFSTLDEKNITPTEKKILEELKSRVGSTKLRLKKIENLQHEVAKELAVKEGVVKEEFKKDMLKGEMAIGTMAKLFMEKSSLSSKVINLATKIWEVAVETTHRKVIKEIDKFHKLLAVVEEEAKQKGVEASTLLWEVRKDSKGERTLKLKRKIDPKFYTAINDALNRKDKKFILDNIDVEKYNEIAGKILEEKLKNAENAFYSLDEEEADKLKTFEITRIKNNLDINRPSFNGYQDGTFNYILRQTYKTDDYITQEYKEMSEGVKALWQFFTDLNIRGKQTGYINKEGLSFVALVEGNTSEKLGKTSNLFSELWDMTKDISTVKINEELNQGRIDEETGEKKLQNPRYFTRTDKTLEQLSTDLNKVGTKWIQALLEYENRENMSGILETMVKVEESIKNFVVEDGNVLMEGGEAKVSTKANENVDILKSFVNDALFNVTEDTSSLGNVAITQVAGKFKKDEVDKEKTVLSVKKIMNTMNTQIRVLGTGLKSSLAIANWAGHQFQAAISSGGMYSLKEYLKNDAKFTTGISLSIEEKALLHLIMPLNEDVAMEKRREMAKKQSLKKWLETWSFVDLMMTPTSFLERKLQNVNAMSFNENHMVVNGKIVGIREFVRKQGQERYSRDENGKFIYSESERKEKEKQMEERINELKETSSLVKIVKIENDEITIPGVTDEEIARYRLKIISFARKLNGQMSREDKAGYRNDSIIRSFMMFKTWAIPLTLQRAGDIRKNYETGEWEYGRTRAFLKVWTHLVNYNVFQMSEILKGTDKGLAILDELYEDKKREHLQKTGRELEISQEEFYELMQQKIREQLKEFSILFSVLGLVFMAKAAQPPEDATDAEKNRYKWWARAVNKISDELTFYYDPTTFENMTKGNIMPALGVLSKIKQFVTALTKETIGYIGDDEKMMKEAHPTKYFMNLIPGAYQFQTGVLPYVWPDWAKDLDIRVTTQSRKQ